MNTNQGTRLSYAPSRKKLDVFFIGLMKIPAVKSARSRVSCTHAFTSFDILNVKTPKLTHICYCQTHPGFSSFSFAMQLQR